MYPDAPADQDPCRSRSDRGRKRARGRGGGGRRLAGGCRHRVGDGSAALEPAREPTHPQGLVADSLDEVPEMSVDDTPLPYPMPGCGVWSTVEVDDRPLPSRGLG